MEKTSAAASELMLNIQKEIQIAAPIAVVFESLIEQMGPDGDWPNGQKMNLRLEAWPGGRWYRDLGNQTGHLWGHVQVIKPPTLLEITGPFVMSYPAINHFQYRLTADGSGTKLTLIHRALGDILPDHRENISKGWEFVLSRIQSRSQK
jgi:uncharacterized protein YndB with AHSA1/START domain